MTIHIDETQDSPRARVAASPQIVHRFKVRADAGETDIQVKDAFRSFVTPPDIGEPPFGDGLPLQDAQVDRLYENAYEAEAVYGAGDAGLANETSEKESFEIQPDRSTKQTAITQTQYGARNGAEAAQPFSVGDSINVSDRGAEGIDIITPVVKFSVSRVFNASQVTPTYKSTLAQLVGTVNDASFRGFAAGEVLFSGAFGELRKRAGDDVWEFRFDFLVKPNGTIDYPAPLLPVPGDPAPIPKEGWDFVWIQSGPGFDHNKGDEYIPSSVYIAQIYPRTDFSGIGVNTA